MYSNLCFGKIKSGMDEKRKGHFGGWGNCPEKSSCSNKVGAGLERRG